MEELELWTLVTHRKLGDERDVLDTRMIAMIFRGKIITYQQEQSKHDLITLFLKTYENKVEKNQDKRELVRCSNIRQDRWRNCVLRNESLKDRLNTKKRVEKKVEDEKERKKGRRKWK